MINKGLIVGILLMVLSGVVCVACLLAPSMTNGRASFEEAMMVFIPSAVLFAAAILLTLVSAVRAGKSKNVRIE